MSKPCFAEWESSLRWAPSSPTATTPSSGPRTTCWERCDPPKRRAANTRFERLGLLKRFTAEERKQFRALLKRREYAAGEILFREGAAGDELYIIISGSASAKLSVAGGGQEKRMREQRLVEPRRGTHFGEMALLDREARSATVQADELLVCYVLDRPAYERLERDMPGSPQAADQSGRRASPACATSTGC